MYKSVEKLVSRIFPLLIAATLSACGGAPADSDSQQSSANNKPTNNLPSSIEASSEHSAIAPSLPSSLAKSSITLSTSSLARSSPESYTRASRPSSAAASSSPEDAGDITPPSTPQLQPYRLSESSITLIWEHAVDDIGMHSYKIYRNDQLVATLDYPMTKYADNNLPSGSTYTYTITALDMSGNLSPSSEPLTIHTLAPINYSSSSASTTSQQSISSVVSSTPISSVSSISVSSRAISSNSTSSAMSRPILKLSWSHPTKRENGSFFELNEIGGYEIRFKQNPTSRYTYLTLSGNHITSYSTNLIPTSSTVEIAVYDTNGFFSDFVSISASPQ